MLPSLIHPDQSGMTLEHDNTKKAFHILDLVRNRGTDMVLLSLDIEKVYDWMDWGMLADTLRN